MGGPPGSRPGFRLPGQGAPKISSSRSRRAAGASTLAAGLLLLCVANAAAATRFAIPGGTGAAASGCPVTKPCSLFAAASATAPETTLRAGDEVLLAPGKYTDAAGDLGPQGSVALAQGITVHGVPNQPRPVIVGAANPNLPFVLQVAAGDVVSHLEIQSGRLRGISVLDGIVEDLIVRDDESFATACSQEGGVIRNTVCLSTGSSGRAVSTGAIGAGVVRAPVLRNVTAIATGNNSIGLSGSSTFGGQNTVNAMAVIAQGALRDVEASARTAPSSTVINLSNSNYDTVFEGPEGGAVTTVTPAGAQGNVTAAPTFATDGFHQARGSSTVDRGATDLSSATTDLDGQSRTIDGTPDIGADELAHPSKVTIACAPGAILLGASFSCTAAVEDTSAIGAVTPVGELLFASSKRGAFSPAARCTLRNAGANRATCEVSYSPAEAGSHTVLAGFPPGGSHDSAVGSTEVTATGRHDTQTTLACAPTPKVSGITCTATVTDRAAGPSVPGGTIALASDKGGTFGEGGACRLAAAGPAQASCVFTYTSSEAGAHRLTAAYKGDPTHLPSEAVVRFEVAARKTPPKTILKKKPRKKTAQRKAVFAFSSDQPRAVFICRLDKGRLRICRSPFKKTVKPGSHSFEVRAATLSGGVDPTPAVYRWKVS
jgi:hypothetical protein